MRPEWELRPLSDIARFENRRRVPLSAKQRESRKGPYPYWGANGPIDSIDDFLFDGAHVLVAEDGNTVVRPDGRGTVHWASGRYWVNNHAHVLSAGDGHDLRWLYYALLNASVRDLVTGSAQPKLSMGSLKRLAVRVPPPEEQVAIAATLGALDDKIESNGRLQDLSGQISAAWFEEETDALEWSVALGDVCEVIDCLHSKKPSELDGEGHGQLLQLSNIDDAGRVTEHPQYFISDDDYESWTRRIELRHRDCVITNVGRVGAAGRVPPIRAALGRNMTGIRCKADWPFAAVLAEALQSRRVRRQINELTDAGTVMNALNVKNIPRLQLPSAETTRLTEWDAALEPVWALRETLLRESMMLKRVRDALLPKLISGKLRVRDAEDLIEEASAA